MTSPEPADTERGAYPLHNLGSNHPIMVLLVSALPPPPGGVMTWTQTLCELGLPPPFKFEVVDTRVFRRSQFTPPRLGLVEIKRNLSILWQIRRALTSGRFSVMHLNCGLTPSGVPRNLASAVIARRAQVPYVAHLHGTFDVPTGNHPSAIFYRRSWRAIFEGAAHILALGQPSYRSILELGDFAHKTTPLIPNFVNSRSIPEHVPPTDRRKSLRVIFTGGLIEKKGVHTIVEIANRVPNTQFQLIGDSSDESSQARLLRHIRELGLQDRVQVSGPVKNCEVVKRLAENDVFIFPSKLKYEGFPTSMAEAMAVGLPVMASPVGAIPEMINVPEGGFLADPDDVDAYVKMLKRLRDEPSLRQSMGQHNKRKALKEYDYDVVIQHLCDIWSAASQHVLR